MSDTILDFNTIRVGEKPLSRLHNNPIIGISVNIDTQTSRLHEAYIQAIQNAGGIPFLIPATDEIDTLRELVERMDGLLLSGGADIGGCYFGEPTLEGLTEVDPERDRYDFILLRIASDYQLPILGICRGMQVINVAFGGGLWQDIPSQYPIQPVNHSVLTNKEQPVHTIHVDKESVLFRILQSEEVGVNSRHHQAVKRVAKGFKVVATSHDGIIEAIEGYPSKRIMGVQWHPENMATEGDNPEMQSLFSQFINEAKLFKQAKKIHNQTLTVDSHCDTPMLFEEHTVDFGSRDEMAQVDLVKMSEGRLDAVFVVAYIPQKYPVTDATKYARELLLEMKNQVEQNRDYAGIASSFDNAIQLKQQGRKAIFLGVENGHALQQNLENLKLFQELGVTYITLCHNGANAICDSAVGEVVHNGLSEFGKQVVQRMNEMGLVIDLSHAAESTFYDVLQESISPVIASHSSARMLCNHPRNLTDNQIKAIATAGGVVQVCLYNGFLVKKGTASIIDAVNHIEHIIEVGGIHSVGIGSDFDGGGGIEGCIAANELINVTIELLRRGYSEKDIALIWGGNLQRVVNDVQQQKHNK